MKRDKVSEGGWEGGELGPWDCEGTRADEDEGFDADTVGLADLESEDEVDPEGANSPELSPLFFSWDSAPRPPEEEEGGGERSSAEEGVAETSSHAWLVLADVRDRVWEDEMGAEEELVCMEGGRGSVEVVGS